MADTEKDVVAVDDATGRETPTLRPREASARAGDSRRAASRSPCGAIPAADSKIAASTSPCRAREILNRVGDKWSVYVIDRLGQGTKRFTELRRDIDGITARMLTVTLRALERDGLVRRVSYPVIPPRVEYTLTPMGQTLHQTIAQLIAWADSHLADIEAARAAYDARTPFPPDQRDR